MKTTGRLIKLAFSLLILFVFAILGWRLIQDRTPKELATLTPDEAVVRAYNENGGELTLLTQDQNTITRGTKNAGYFSVTEDVLIPDANQIQLLFRYNNSTVRALAKDYDLDEVPDRTSELYDVTVLLAIDLTPDDVSDNSGNDPKSVRFVRVHAKSMPMVETSKLYNYRRLVFDVGASGEDLRALLDSGLLLAVYADVYYNQAVNYDETPYGTLCLYDFKTDTETVELTKHDRRALDACGG
jgi:hypothetical protein